VTAEKRGQAPSDVSTSEPVVVEIIVRGVGGETAEEILGGEVYKVSGDRDAGFYRTKQPRDHSDTSCVEPSPPEPACITEAYEWGRLTSGSSMSAGFWLLLPFTLFNVAGWTLPMSNRAAGSWAAPEQPMAPRFSSLVLVRAALVTGALLLTTLYVLWIAAILVGIVACPDQCPADGWLNVDTGIALLCLAWLGLALYVSRSQTLEWYEPDSARRYVGRGTRRLRRNTRLGNGAFWYRWTEYRRLWRWHLGASAFLIGLVAAVATRGAYAVTWRTLLPLGTAFVLFGLASDAERRPERVAGPRVRPTLFLVVPGLVYTAGLAAAFGLGLHLSKGVLEPLDAGSVARSIVLLVQWATVSLFVLMVLALVAQLDKVRFGPSRVIGLLMTGLAAVGLAALFVFPWGWGTAALCLAVVVQAIRGRGPGWTRRIAPILLAAFSVSLAGAGLGSAYALVGYARLGGDEFDALGAPATFQNIVILGLGLAVVVLLILAMLRESTVGDVISEYFRGRESPLGSASQVALKVAPELTAPDLNSRQWRWAKSIARRRKLSDLGPLVPGILAVAAAVVVVATISSYAFEWMRGPRPPLTEIVQIPLLGWERTTTQSRLVSGFFVLFLFPGVWLIRLAARSRDNRRSIAKVWDVMGFWPRRFHAIGAPCYAERAVPELRGRIEHHLRKGRAVIVSAHSQGSVIAYAALVGLVAAPAAQEEDEVVDIRRVALATYGSPLTTMYGPNFPAYFGVTDTFGLLREALAPIAGAGWRSFYRPTDYIGKRVFELPGGVLNPVDAMADVRLPESIRFDSVVNDGVGLSPPPVLAPLHPPESHSNYDREPQFRAWMAHVKASLAELLASPPPSAPPPPAEVPPT
jgi:hypothetical protein